MKPTLILLLVSCLGVYGATEEQINAEFVVQANGKLVVDVDFGAIEVNTNGGAQVTVDVFRSVSRSSKADEEAFLAEHPVKFSQDGNIIRRKQFVLQPMNEEEALEQMELLGHSFFVFWNAADERMCVLYRRKDGDYGLLEPELT